jgi:hypothetical protein
MMLQFWSYQPLSSVTPAKAGVQLATLPFFLSGIPAFAGKTGVETLRNISQVEVIPS